MTYVPHGCSRSHLAIPPVEAFPSFSYKSPESLYRNVSETREGGKEHMPTVLVIDDEESIRTIFQLALERAGYRALTAEHGKHGLRLLEHQDVDLILVDLFMPEMDGLELIRLLRRMRPACKIIAISGRRSDKQDYLDIATYLGAHATLEKPLNLQDLLDTVASQLKCEDLERTDPNITRHERD